MQDTMAELKYRLHCPCCANLKTLPSSEFGQYGAPVVIFQLRIPFNNSTRCHLPKQSFTPREGST